MWRALLFLVLVALAAFGAVWISEHPGNVTLVWGGYEIGTSLAIALVGVLVAAIVLGVIWALVRGLIGLPGSISRSTQARRRKRGMLALSRGMVAVGSGDPLSAQRHAGDAERLLGPQPLTLLLQAQAAQIAGNRPAAERAFHDMAENPETRILGLRGLFVEARRRDDEVAARAYASEAARLAPSVTWANEAVLEAQCADGDWSAATETVERRASLGLLDKSSSRRQRAVLLTAAAEQHEAGEPDLALEQSLKAVRLAPELVPAACIAGRLLARKGDFRKAAKIIEAAWKSSPHPDLAKVYIGLRIGDSTQDRLVRAETLAKLSTWDAESRLVVAQIACEAREFAKAREAIAPLLDDHPRVGACLMMARIEEAEHGTETGRSREWLARATRAPRDPAWIADGVASERWAPVSPVTGHLDAFVWQTPQEILAGPDETRDRVDPPEPPKPPDSGNALPLSPPKPVVVANAPVTQAKPLPSGGTPAGSTGASPASQVVFPLPRAPDDPGSAGDDDDVKPRRIA